VPFRKDFYYRVISTKVDSVTSGSFFDKWNLCLAGYKIKKPGIKDTSIDLGCKNLDPSESIFIPGASAENAKWV
jgi:hypothetical protein